MTTDFDAIIVGSGFGGSVMAYRLAEAGLRVCVLERGKAYPPGSFARSPHALGRNFWDPSEGLHGLFDIWSFRGTEAVVASGLGGGSLIYANVLIRKPPQWFVDRDPRTGAQVPWPITRDDLDPHYDRVEQILNGQEFPLGAAAAYQAPKTLALQWAAQQLGLQWYLPNLAITFANDNEAPRLGAAIKEKYQNYHRAERFTCRMCGECDIGCNFGSKNTLDFTYLSLASLNGAQIRPLHEVRTLRPLPAGAGYAVDFVVHTPENEGHPTATHRLPIETLRATHVVLSAGTLGSTYLLLKCRPALPRISDRLGERFSTNGDLLTFAVRCTRPGSGGPQPRVLDPSRGPVITSTIYGDSGAQGDPHSGYFLQDAGYPQFVNWIMETADAPGHIGRLARFLWHRLQDWVTGTPHDEISGQLASALGACELSHDTMPLLGMGRDIPDGKMMLRRGRDGQEYLEVDWRNIRSAGYFNRVTEVSRRVAQQLGGKFIQNPDTQFLNRLITVHALGGCPMGNSPSEGVVDPYGQVFGHEGLYVADGSVMPGPTGSNPSLTIAALADRFADGIIRRWNPSPDSMPS
jgi:cholesterol oxidase